MHPLRGLFLALQAASVLAVNLRRDGSSEAPRKANQFIVEVDSVANLGSAESKIKEKGGRILKKFDSEIFAGFSVETEVDNVDTLQQVAEISTAWPLSLVFLSDPALEASFSDDATAGNYSVHEYTGVDKAHEAGITGKGVVIAVVDTGIDYNHPALGGGFGPGFKVAGGVDLVGDGFWPDSGSKTPDLDPKDGQTHGTHVAGIIAGKTEWFTGVAPDATLLAFKVFSQAGTTDEATLIEAFLAAYDAGADIITSSIGGPSGWSSNAWGVVSSRLVEKGVVVTISAGNSGSDGPVFASSGSSGKNVLAIASTDPKIIGADPFEATFTLGGVSNTTNLAYRAGVDPWTVKDLEIQPLNLDPTTENDACLPLPADTPDLSKGIVLIRRGGCTFEEKQLNAKKFGAKYILFYNSDAPLVAPGSSTSDPPIAMIESKAGKAIIETVKAGGKVTVDFSKVFNFKVGAFNSAGGIPSQYTSWGPLYDFDIKPDVATPGANILSTIPNNQWGVKSGTSMACPYAAGIVALYISKFGGRNVHGPEFARKLVNRIRSTGMSIPWQFAAPTGLPVDYGFWAPVAQVGAGQVDAWRVLNQTTSLSFDQFVLNDTHHFERYHFVDITNEGNKAVTYKFTVQPAGTFDAQSKDSSPYLATFVDPYKFVPKVFLPDGVFTVNPGETKRAQINFDPPEGLVEEALPIYSGKILISGNNGDELSVPYLGAGFNAQRQLMGAMFANGTPRQVAGPDREDIATYHSYAFNVSRGVQDFPRVDVELKWGTKELRWDIFEESWNERDWKYPPLVGQAGYLGAVTYFNESSAAKSSFDPETMNREATSNFPEQDVYRTSSYEWEPHSYWWMGKFANGSYIQPGKYKMRFAVLTPFGTPQNSDNWDIWNTPVFEVRPLEI